MGQCFGCFQINNNKIKNIENNELRKIKRNPSRERSVTIYMEEDLLDLKPIYINDYFTIKK